AGAVAEPGYLPLLGWLMWPGIGLMIGGAFTALIASWPTLRAGLRGLDEIRPGRGVVAAAAVAAIAVVGLGRLALGAPPAITALAIAASAVLAAAAARATGETDNTPAGALGGLGQIAVGALGPGGVAAPLVAGGVIQGTAMHSSVMLGNWRTGLALGSSPRAQLVAQLIGAVVGAAASGAVLALIRSGPGLASPAMPSPVALSWKATAELVQGGASALPAGAPLAALIGVAAGAALGVAGRRWRWVPAPVPIGMAFLLPPHVSLTMALGALGFALLARARPAWHASHAATLASGLIAGESLVGLLGAALAVWR
ncbi:MAG TPA: OPT/YSL family transporter, partial [Kofleriaceae bacterium]|nr:OPT/YSL family transporter [Kofleriaceae bacterium]